MRSLEVINRISERIIPRFFSRITTGNCPEILGVPFEIEIETTINFHSARGSSPELFLNIPPGITYEILC